jgi:hypothetical protein
MRASAEGDEAQRLERQFGGHEAGILAAKTETGQTGG